MTQSTMQSTTPSTKPGTSPAAAPPPAQGSFPDLSRFFAPRSVALVGATEDLGKFGGRSTRLMMDFGYTGRIYPVNPNRKQIFGMDCFPSITDLPEAPDHVGLVLPASAIPGALEQCAARGVPFVTVFSAGFGESGTEEGRREQRRIVDIAHAGGIRIMGPNCNGLINFVDGFALTSTGTIARGRCAPGDIGVATQSGGAGQVNVMWRAQQAGLGISYQVSCGNAADLDLFDYANFMVESAATRVVLIIAEHIADGDKLRALARRALELEKPIVMIKVGRTEAGSRAAASHTGALTGADAVCDAALAQMGILRVDDCNDLYETAMLLRRGRWPAGRRAAATSISGGNLVMVADLGAGLGIEWPAYTEQTQQALGACLPGFGTASNPTDLTAAAINQEGKFVAAVTTILADPNVDALVPVLTIAQAKEVRGVAEMSDSSDKAVTIVWTGETSDEPSLTPHTLVTQGHAVYRDAMPALKALRAAMTYGEFQARRTRPAVQRPDGINTDAARALLAAADGPLSEYQSKALLRCYGLPVTQEYLAKTADEAVAFATRINGPVALKIQSPDIPHKTEAKAIRLHVQGDAAVRDAWQQVSANALLYKAAARIEGVLVQEMVSDAREMLVGITQDPSFGPVLTVGLGGIFVEVFKDVAFRLPPLDAGDALSALHELKSFRMLEGVRGQPAADIAALADCIARVSWLAFDLKDLIAELDINPLSVLPQGRGVRIVDALVVPRAHA